jgi:hypothetical protein
MISGFRKEYLAQNDVANFVRNLENKLAVGNFVWNCENKTLLAGLWRNSTIRKLGRIDVANLVRKLRNSNCWQLEWLSQMLFTIARNEIVASWSNITIRKLTQRNSRCSGTNCSGGEFEAASTRVVATRKRT